MGLSTIDLWLLFCHRRPHSLADAAEGAPEALAPGPRAEAPTAQGVLAAARARAASVPRRRPQAGGLLRLSGLGQRRPHSGTIHKGCPHQGGEGG